MKKLAPRERNHILLIFTLTWQTEEIIDISISISEMNTRISYSPSLLVYASVATHTSHYVNIWNKLTDSDTAFITDFLILEEYVQL